MRHTEIYWKPNWTVGLEHLVVREGEDGIDADGLVLAHYEGTGLRMRYHVRCDTGWRVRQVEAQIEHEKTVHRKMSADGAGNWLDESGKPLDALAGCIDVDIMATPFTNTLPIRRLGLAVGESKEIAVAYIKIPDLKIERAAQRYTFLARDGDKSRYLYEGLGTDFKAELLVDAEGLVIDYQGIWERVKAS